MVESTTYRFASPSSHEPALVLRPVPMQAAKHIRQVVLCETLQDLALARVPPFALVGGPTIRKGADLARRCLGLGRVEVAAEHAMVPAGHSQAGVDRLERVDLDQPRVDPGGM
jgi:hypothetical protein